MVFTKLLLENALAIRPCDYEAASEPLLPKAARCIPVLSSCYVGKCAVRVLKRSGLGKKPAFSFHFFVYEVQGSVFCMSMSYHIRQLVLRSTAVFLLKRLIFLENGQNCHSVVFTVLQIHIKIKSLLEYKSVWPSGCVFRSHSCTNLIAL